MSVVGATPTIYTKNQQKNCNTRKQKSQEKEALMCKFRNLKADEIDVRVSQISDKGCFSLLLYKDARCDMSILDETVGSYNWKREHSRDNANCTVSLWDKEKQQWISKEDTGTESNTEKEKGLASDSFKRACFNWGIGRELYTAPSIWVYDTSYIKKNSKGKDTVYERFTVKSIETSDDKVIKSLEIIDSKGKIVFSTKQKITPKKETKKEKISDDLILELKSLNVDEKGLCKYFGVDKIEDLSLQQAEQAIQMKKKGA